MEPLSPEYTTGADGHHSWNAYAEIALGLLELLDVRDDVANQAIIEQLLGRLAADGCPQPVIDLYRNLAQRVSGLVIDKHIRELIKGLLDQQALHAAKIPPVSHRPGRKAIPQPTRDEFVAQIAAGERQFIKDHGRKPNTQAEMAAATGMPIKRLRKNIRDLL
jgi:hypothetical protein